MLRIKRFFFNEICQPPICLSPYVSLEKRQVVMEDGIIAIEEGSFPSRQ
jgi:hypothetical protein